MIEPKYLNLLALGITTPPMVTSLLSPSTPLNLHFRYSIFNLLNPNPLDSRVCLHYSNLSSGLSLVSLIKTISSANNIHKRTSSWIYLVSSSIIIVNRNRLKAKPQWSPMSIRKNSVSPVKVLTRIFAPVDIFLIARISPPTTLSSPNTLIAVYAELYHMLSLDLWIRCGDPFLIPI